MTARTTAARELALRGSDGVRALLLWHPRVDAVTVPVEDARALDAFHQPFAYAA